MNHSVSKMAGSIGTETEVGSPSQLDDLSSVMRISIVTATFNAAKTLLDTIESVLPHLSDEVEFIVIDGGSTDETLEIIKKYNQYIAYWISEPDGGIYDAWNKGLRAARGEYVAFLGADDLLNQNYSEMYLSAISRFPAADYFSSKVVLNNTQGRIIGRPFCSQEFCRYMTVAHVGSLHSLRLYEKHGMYDTSYRIVADYQFLLRCGPSLKTCFIDAVTVSMGPDGVSNSSYLQALAEQCRAKIETKVRGQFLARFELLIGVIKISLRRLLRL